MAVVKPVKVNSAAAKRVQASKARQKSRIQQPASVSDISGLDAIKSVMGQTTGTKVADPVASGDVPWKQKFNEMNTPPGTPRTTTISGNTPPPVSPGMDDGLGGLQSALEQMIRGSAAGGMSDKEIARLINQSVSGTFNPQIKAIQQEMGSAKKRAKTARADLKALYNDLSGYYDSRIGASGKMYGVAQRGAQARTEGLKNAITQDYTERLKEQVDMYKSLGIEAAAPSATEGQYADQASQLATADMSGNAEAQALAVQQQGDQTYWNEGAAIAQLEGTEQQTNVITQLQDYLNSQGSSLAGLKGQKSAAYSQAMLEAKQKKSDQAAQRQNEIWNRMMDLARLKQSAARSSGSGSEKTPTKGIAGVAAYLGSQRLANEFQTSMQQATTWNQSPQAKQYYGGQVPNTPEEMAQVIRDNAANRGLSPDDQLKLWQAALVYYNKLT